MSLSSEEIYLALLKKQKENGELNPSRANYLITQSELRLARVSNKKRKEKYLQEKINASRKQSKPKNKSGKVKILYVTSYPEPPRYMAGMKSDFYQTREWKELRWKVIEKSKGVCVVCGRSKKSHGVIMHVDHIKPRSKFPDLELNIDNLQLLCEDCNIGKGARIQSF